MKTKQEKLYFIFSPTFSLIFLLMLFFSVRAAFSGGCGSKPCVVEQSPSSPPSSQRVSSVPFRSSPKRKASTSSRASPSHLRSKGRKTSFNYELRSSDRPGTSQGSRSESLGLSPLSLSSPSLLQQSDSSFDISNPNTPVTPFSPSTSGTPSTPGVAGPELNSDVVEQFCATLRQRTPVGAKVPLFVMIVEDNSFVRRLLVKNLSRFNSIYFSYPIELIFLTGKSAFSPMAIDEVSHASYEDAPVPGFIDGEDAIGYLDHRSSNPHFGANPLPDIIFMDFDLKRPNEVGKNGVQTLQEINRILKVRNHFSIQFGYSFEIENNLALMKDGGAHSYIAGKKSSEAYNKIARVLLSCFPEAFSQSSSGP